ncbi:hypothetical protein DFH06DRAFT_1136082 [Mycena polygramma]|nr:hypothetical protein DFH06DRAFT_1136082 [Mycena polygramma]
MDTERLEVMDSQRFDASKLRINRKNLSIQTGLSDEENSVHSSRSTTPSLTFERDSSPDRSDSASDSRESSPPTSENTSLLSLGKDTNLKSISQIDVFEKDGFTTTRTIVRPIPSRSRLPKCFSRPSSPVASRPSSPRPTSPINFGALNCFANADAFAEEVDYVQAQRERELEGLAEVKIHVHRDELVSTETTLPLPPSVEKYANPEALRLNRRALEPTGSVTCP